MAFNSGLLSTSNTQLNNYLQVLNQDDCFKKIVRPNDDIPTPTDLKITITDKCALTRHNLALLGALDDFYQLYVDVYDFIVQQMVEHTKKVFAGASVCPLPSGQRRTFHLSLSRLHQVVRGQSGIACHTEEVQPVPAEELRQVWSDLH